MSNQVLALLLTLALFVFLGGWALFIDFLQRKRRKDVSLSVTSAPRHLFER
jgi:hypothetical protein